MSCADFNFCFGGILPKHANTQFSSAVMFLVQVALTHVLNLVGMMDLHLFVPMRMKPIEPLHGRIAFGKSKLRRRIEPNK